MVGGLLAIPLPASPGSAAAPAVAPASTGALAAKQKNKKAPTPAQLAFGARQKKCGAEWRPAKAAGKSK